MSYAISGALQSAVYDRLAGDADLSALVGDDIYDGIPTGAVPSLYVSLGEETVTDRSDTGTGGAWHDFTVAVVTQANGFAEAKAVGGVISDALLAGGLTLSRGHVVGIWFRAAEARRVQKSDLRRIDLRFRAQVLDNS